MARHSATRLNEILRIVGGKRYLEIGVASGQTFSRIEADVKVAVDPKFRFDYSSLGSAKVSYVECTSDNYFVNHCNSQFDVIFLDGLHTFEQTLRDLIHALNVCRSGGVIVIDDVMPLDFAGSLKSMRQMREFRLSHADQSPMHWWGDVFKLVPAIHDFFLTIDFRTAVEGKIQTVVVKRKPSTPRVPHFSDLADIAKLEFRDIKAIEHLWRLGSEFQVYEFLRDPNAGSLR